MKNNRKCLPLFGLALAVAVLSNFTLAPIASAREKLTVSFVIEQDASRNVKPATFSETEKVRRREYNRLIESGENAYEVRADGGYHCRIRHTENIRFNVRIDKRTMKLNPEGRIPNCSDFQIRVRTRGR